MTQSLTHYLLPHIPYSSFMYTSTSNQMTNIMLNTIYFGGLILLNTCQSPSLCVIELNG